MTNRITSPLTLHDRRLFSFCRAQGLHKVMSCTRSVQRRETMAPKALKPKAPHRRLGLKGARGLLNFSINRWEEQRLFNSQFLRQKVKWKFSTVLQTRRDNEQTGSGESSMPESTYHTRVNFMFNFLCLNFMYSAIISWRSTLSVQFYARSRPYFFCTLTWTKNLFHALPCADI